MPPATRIVGIGASAGGLVALEEFFEHMPGKCGLAYVVVQHLDPTHKAMLAELLQRVTVMPVRQAECDVRVEPNHVYVIPPNTELSVAGDHLNLTTPEEPRGQRMPIDVLFSSLAGAQGERAIAVVLSGMGSDGTLGMQAVKAVGGLTAAQLPESAQFDSMPKTAIAAGGVDIVAPAGELPARILSYVARVPDPDIPAPGEPEGTDPDPHHDILGLLRARTGHDFSLYKPSTLQRRIGRRMVIHGLATQAEYVGFLRHNPQELDLLFNELLIGVTSFFRDAAVWEHLANVALPDLLARRGNDHALRAWVIGCSTGEEAYSLAMVFTETLQRLGPSGGRSLQIFASDLSPDAVATARRGRYPATISENVSPDRLARYFSPHEAHFQVNKSIRDMVLFAHHDVVLDPPFTKLDLISCRNLLIYFDARLQRRLLPLFHYSLRPGGLLLLGSAETVGRFNHLFSPIDAKLRLYVRQDSVSSGHDILLKSFPPLSRATKEPPVPRTEDTVQPNNLQAAADHVLLQVYSPAAVVINGSGDIVYISGRTGNYLEPAAGKANWNFHAMIREGLRAPIAEALKRAAAQREPVQLHALEVQLPGGEQIVDVTVQALREPAALDGMTMIVFRDIVPVSPVRRRRRTKSAIEASFAEELQQHRDEILSLREESRASREQLQSTNEELQSTNEELQSANEELTTSKEEMQSMNEELQTINAELQTKLDDLALAQSDMQNLLNSVDIAILFLDQDLNVRRYTDRTARIINLRESDVGRPLSDLTTSLRYPEFHDDALETLRTLEISEKQILTDDGRWFSVRIMPYRRLDNVIDGIVVTLVDITETKKLESVLRQNPPA
jgi:two-component system CheB/CheR fusion protein